MTAILVIAAGVLAAPVCLAAFLAVARLRGWRIGRWSWPFQRGEGACRRCLTTYRFAIPHPTVYDATTHGTRRAMFPLCEQCWAELGSPEARYPYYADTLMEQADAARARGDEQEVARILSAGTNVVAALRAGL